MSYAVIQTGGKQYKVKSGEIIKIEKLSDSKPDTKIEFKENDLIVDCGANVGELYLAFETLGKNKINIQVITTSEIKISILIDEKFTDLAVQKLHKAYKLHI